MIRRSIAFSPEARGDLVNLYDWIADAASAETALAYIERIEAFLTTFDIGSERGVRRDDIRPGLRIIGFERRLTVAFTVYETEVVILRLFYGGQNWPATLEDEA
ncbi:MAG: type II toxin-antitoxin system RelE/ParE family toxin [Caulobacteraceae bacterium]